MKILITGASGFIGSFLVEEALRRGMEVWAAVRASSSRAYLTDGRIRFIDLDLMHDDRLCDRLAAHVSQERRGWDYIIHCAGATKCRRAQDFDRINYEATVRLVDTLRALHIVPRQFIYISSLSVYGPIREADYSPIRLDDTPRPNTAYGVSKLKAERYLQASDDIPYVIFRPTGVYGPRERDYYLMAKSIRSGVDVAVGYKRQDLTFVYVLDVVQAVYLAIDRGVSRRAYFVSDGRVYASRAFSDYIQKELKKKRVVHLKLPLCVLKAVSLLAETWASCLGKSSTLNRDKYKIMKQRNWQCDTSPLVEELGYCPAYDLERGVRETVAWYKKEGWL